MYSLCENVRTIRKRGYPSSEQGYERPVSQGGTNVFGGQKQLLTIAQPILADKPIMILDEAISSGGYSHVNFDPKLHEQLNGWTSFVIAHRLSTINDADKILYIQDGDIKETRYP